jgi:hypothetical protein
MREKFKRMLVLTFQFDAYFALTHGKPPLLHLQEIDVGLPSTFALWNAYGLDVFALRELEEPPDRSKVRVSEITGRSDSVIFSELLVEDMHLGLCSLLQSIWVLSQRPNKKENPGRTSQKSLLVRTLDAWKHDLDKLHKLADHGNFTGNAAKYLLLAYRGEDNSVTASLERIKVLVQDGMILYYHLKLMHYVFDIVGPGKGVGSRTEPWETSKYSEEALVCALHMLKVVESKTSFNPIIRHALIMGVDVVRVLLLGQNCQCLNEDGQHAANNTLQLQHWSDIGGLWIDGTPVCVCKLAVWVERFEKAIQSQNIMVE